MNDIINTLFIKRFCLPSDIDIKSYESGENNVPSCLCGNFNHACAIFYKENSLSKNVNILSFGFNNVGNILENEPGIHAEHDAILKLKPLERKKHLVCINLLVIRITKRNKTQLSKPCVNCIKKMKYLPEKKGYKIKNIYYSNENGDIVKSNITKLENEELHYSRFFRKNYKDSHINKN
jgi:hypothetical protein